VSLEKTPMSLLFSNWMPEYERVCIRWYRVRDAKRTSSHGRTAGMGMKVRCTRVEWYKTAVTLTRRSEPVVRRSSQTNMFLVRNRLHTKLIHRWHRNASRALPSRHYVQPTHTRPALAASVTPVKKILLDTIKVHASRDFPIPLSAY
jgi:hypothetical protein